VTLLLLLKPHPRLAGRGQQLIIQKAIKEEEEIPFLALKDEARPKITSSLEYIAKNSSKLAIPSYILPNKNNELAEQIEDDLSLEELALLFMMTEE